MALCGGMLCHSTGCLRNRGGAGDFHRPYETQKPFPFTIHRTTLPQSAHSGCQLPQRGSRESLHHSSGYSLKSQVTGDFHRPYENSETVSFYHSSGDTPSVSHSLDSSLREGAGNEGAVPFNLPPGNRNVAGDFHRPYETQNFLPVSTGVTIPGGAGHLPYRNQRKA